MSLRRRVLLGFLLIAFVLVSANIAITATTRSMIIGQVDENVRLAGQRFATGPMFQRFLPPPSENDGSSSTTQPNNDGRPDIPRPNDDQRANDRSVFSEFYIAVYSQAGERFVEALPSSETDPPKIPTSVLTKASQRNPGQPLLFTTSSTNGDEQWRVSIRPARFGSQSTTVVTAINLRQADKSLMHIRRVQIISTLLVLIALGIVGFWVMRLGVRPVADMAEASKVVAEGDLTHRVEYTDERTEAGTLGSAFNTMLDRIKTSFDEKEQTEQRLRQFAADASHELRTPLTSIQGLSELWLQGGLQSENELRDAMERIHSEAIDMSALVNDLLLLVRLDEHAPIEKRDVALDQCVGEVVDHFKQAHPNRTVTFTATPVVLAVAETQIRAAIQNLLTNVGKHTAETDACDVSVAADDNNVTITVTDHGPGMSEETASHVFERFYRADPSRHGLGGGLGLSIVDSVAKAHGGEANVTSEKGKGSTFVITLPLSS